MENIVLTMPVHPAAEVFPMLPPDELSELADDIKANGLAHPIVVKDGVLIDGRNRRAACLLAGVTPHTVELNGQDPVAYILSTNITRRHLSKGQRAVATAMLYPDPATLKRIGSGSLETKDQISGGYVSKARTILRWAPELADVVLAGAIGLDAAYETAKQRKLDAEAPQIRLATLRAADPDLADKVVEGDVDLADAEAASTARRKRERESRQGVYNGIKSVEDWKFMFSGANAEYLVRICREHPDELSASAVVDLIDELTAAFAAIKKELSNGR